MTVTIPFQLALWHNYIRVCQDPAVFPSAAVCALLAGTLRMSDTAPVVDYTGLYVLLSAESALMPEPRGGQGLCVRECTD